MQNDVVSPEHVKANPTFAMETVGSTGPIFSSPSPASPLPEQLSISDPHTWSWSKKHRVLLALGSASLLCDWGMTWGTTLFEAQARTWDMQISDVANSISGGIFLQGPGGILAVPLAQRYGRLPVLFWSQLLSCIVVVAAALSPSYVSFTTSRCLQGLFNTAPQVIGLSIIYDMFNFDHRVRKVNIWTFSFFCGPYLGPFISGLLIGVLSWRAVYGVLAGLHALSLLTVIALGEETLHDNTQLEHNTKAPIKLFRLIGCTRAMTRPSLQKAMIETFRIAFKPYLLLPGAIYTCITFMWLIGIITTFTQFVKSPPYLLSDLATATLYLAPFTGALLANIWGHFFNDHLQKRYLLQHNGQHEPENRLWAAYPAAVLAASGLILYGQTLQHQLHWIGLAIGWAMLAAGVLAGTTVVNAYVMDCFKEHAAAASGWVNFWRTTGGFCVPYFQRQWVQRSGAGVVFGTQAGMLSLAVGAICITHNWGKQWRRKHAEVQ